MIVALRMLRQLLGYALVATLLVSPIGLFYALCGIGCLLRNDYCFKQWLALDILACTTIHNTQRRTISGFTGQHLHINRYALQAKFIDSLAIMCGDSKNHCLRSYEWEKRILNL